MAGNVWEWCSDYYDPDYYADCLATGTTINPTGPPSGTTRIMRGGSWNNGTYSLRCAGRHAGKPGEADMFTGFRCVKNVDP
jgi:iron(II)-dependent oxidoreductase